ncbi:MAG TPA: hypothetical protein DCG57_01100 [Candidatus Riflebacteria bacterium]|jgi:hypothetical protein|nr:hypothetical protein [Candidatus Riflebacteria bacterium]
MKEKCPNSSAHSYAGTMKSKSSSNIDIIGKILHTLCAELIKYSGAFTAATPSNSMGLKLQQNLQPLVGENHLTLLSNRNAMRTELSRSNNLSTIIRKQPNLEPLVRETSGVKNLLTVIPSLPGARCERLPSPEAIAERLRLWANSAESTTGDDQPEVEL